MYNIMYTMHVPRKLKNSTPGSTVFKPTSLHCPPGFLITLTLKYRLCNQQFQSLYALSYAIIYNNNIVAVQI